MRAILTFHSIDGSGSVLSFPRVSFEALLHALDRSGLPVVSIGELRNPETRRGIALTFDDGMMSVLTEALPVLREFAVPAHLFLSTDYVGRSNQWPGQNGGVPVFDMLDWAGIEVLQANGISIESHTTSHPDLRRLSDEQIEAECLSANEEIERKLGVRPRYFAFPYGYHDERVRAVTSRLYEACVTTELRSIGNAEEPAALPRLDTYYLRPAFAHRHLDTGAVRGYLRLRNLVRRIRDAC